MKQLLAFVMGMMMLGVSAVKAQERIILVELFTSQGCYSCPPADKILEQMVGMEDILPLSLHVDYWDYLGWKDAFAIAKFGERQASYNAQIINRGRRVTPQMIFDGVAEVAGGVGRSVQRINMTLETLRKREEAAEIEIARTGNVVTVELMAKKRNLGQADISLVQFTPAETVKIERGENAGKKLTYHNVVKSLEVIDRWDTSSTKTIKVTLPRGTEDQFALIVQGKRFGPVFVARNLGQAGLSE